MKVKKLNIKRLLIFIGVVLVVLLLLIVFIKLLISNYKEKQTYEYKLSEIGYKEKEISTLLKKLNEKELDSILSKKYNSDLDELVLIKHFSFKNLDEYTKFINETDRDDYERVVAMINTNANNWYENIKDTDVTKNQLMLVNKNYKLSNEYVPSDIISIPTSYAYSGKYMSETAYDNMISMFGKAKEDGFTFVVNSGYRSYSSQEEIYNSYKVNYSVSEADEIAARAGHSEYQTGLSLEFSIYGKNIEDSEAINSDEYNWLINNAYKYGFILRYPQDKEELTGFDFNPWRYRYVGSIASRIIYDENITFEEYYEYYVK